MKQTRHTSQLLATTRRTLKLPATFIIAALLALASPAAFATTDNQAIPPIVPKSTVADLVVPDIVPLQGAVVLTVGHPNVMFIANTGYQKAFLEGVPVSFGSKNIIATASPQIGTGYANQSAATQQAGGFGMNLGATSWSPPANVTFTGTIADTSPGIFALIS